MDTTNINNLVGAEPNLKPVRKNSMLDDNHNESKFMKSASSFLNKSSNNVYSSACSESQQHMISSSVDFYS